jgi:hypothetical protein
MPDAIHSFKVDAPAILFKLDRDPTITKTRTFLYILLDRLDYGNISDRQGQLIPL